MHGEKEMGVRSRVRNKKVWKVMPQNLDAETLNGRNFSEMQNKQNRKAKVTKDSKLNSTGKY